MAKPILSITIPSLVALTVQQVQSIIATVKISTDNEYHVIVTTDSNLERIVINCFNNCTCSKENDVDEIINKILSNN